METLTDNLKGKLRAFIDAWTQERHIDEEIRITSSEVTIRRQDKTINIHPNELLNFDGFEEKKTLLEKCKMDLDQPGIDIIDYPEYLQKRDDKRLKRILKKIREPDFRIGEPIGRLETYYYLGEALASRGWLRSDKRMLQDRIGERATKDTIRIARRVYELFITRGLAQLYTVTFIQPTHFLQLTEDQFYNQLIPFARNLREEEKFVEGFAGAHPLGEGIETIDDVTDLP